MSRSTLRILAPNGHLGFAPMKTGSFERGVATRPDVIAADSGDDIGPGPLGSDASTNPEAWQRHDLEQILVASRTLDVPMIIGSAGDTGANSRVDMYVAMIREIAARHALPAFRLGYFYSEVPTELLRSRMAAGEVVKGLDGRPDLSLEGSMINDGRNILFVAWWVSTIPGIALLILVLSINLFGEQLRDILEIGG